MAANLVNTIAEDTQGISKYHKNALDEILQSRFFSK